MSKFTHLHVHSHYSLLDGLPKIDELLDYVKELGMDSVALTDHGTMYGAVEFYKKAKEKGIKPILGSEVYVAFEKMTDERPNIDDKRYHLILLVKNETGYKNLVKLITKAHLEGFYYKPRIDEELLEKHCDGLIALSGCVQGKIPRLILANKIKEAEDLASRYKKLFGENGFYLEIQSHQNIPEQKIVNDNLIAISKKCGIPLVATNDIHYLKPEDSEAQDILMLINTGSKPNDPDRLTLKDGDFSMTLPEKMLENFKDVPEAIENTRKIAAACDFQFELGKAKLPGFEVPGGKSPNDYLKELCEQRLKARLGETAEKPEVIGRLKYELSIIEKTGFAPYFLIVQDFVNWAKENRIAVGPGRGSAAGSLVSYILGITNVNPIKYELLFERFLNPDRISLPDIDLDFSDRRRDEVIAYVSQKYGAGKVAQIITFGTMAARAVIRDVGRALDYQYSYCDQLAKMIPFGLTLDETMKKVDEFRQIYEEDFKAQRLIDLAKKLEGCARHASTHACGVVISSEPLENIVPLQHPTQNDKTIVTQYEMHAIEDLGLLKIDFLGLKNLTIIEDTLTRIYVVQNKKVDIENLPLDDKETFELLREGNCVGIFQLESDGMRRYLKQLKPARLEDIIAMVALYRPGPIELIPDYIARKNGNKEIPFFHPKLKPILENTYGIPVYQEQIMRIARELAGFTLAEADILRKAIGKKIKGLLMAQKEKFIRGAEKNGVSQEISKKIWDWIEPFASYSFNRSHAAAYALIAYQTAYLKTHFPVEFMAALLTSEKNDVERIGFLIEECKKMKIEVLPPDINESFINFSVIPGQKQIRFGLLAIKNVGANAAEAVIRERKLKPYGSIQDFVSRLNTRDLNRRSMESLIKTGAFDKFGERSRFLANLEKLLEFARENQKTKSNGQMGLFDGKTAAPGPVLAPAPETTEQEKLTWEKELLGLFVSSHPLKAFKKILAEKTLSIADLKNRFAAADSAFGLYEPFAAFEKKERIRIGGVICQIKKILTKTGSPMLFVNLEDLTDRMEVVVFPSVLEKNPVAFQENKVVLVSGRVNFRGGAPKLICENIEEIVER